MSRIIGFVLLALALIALRPAMANTDPSQLVKETSDKVLQEVASRKQELEASPGKIYELVDDIVLPRFDFERMSRLVLGKYWRQASEEEKEAFILAFREMLVRTYATALLSYSGEEIVYLPFRNNPGATEVKVDTQFSSPGAPPVPINYSLYQNGSDWKVYDVSIDGVSLVSNYRSSFSSQIRRYKLSGLIAKLEKRNKRDK